MNKKKFLSALKKALAELPRQDRKKTLDFYSELIDDRLEEGLGEDAILADIGTPESIAAQVISELPVKPRKKVSWGIILLLILGSPLWLSLVIAVAAVLLAVLISLYAVELSLAAYGIAGFISGLIFLILWEPYAALALLGSGLVCLGLSIPCYYLCVLATKAFWRLTKSTCRSIFRKG